MMQVPVLLFLIDTLLLFNPLKRVTPRGSGVKDEQSMSKQDKKRDTMVESWAVRAALARDPKQRLQTAETYCLTVPKTQSPKSRQHPCSLWLGENPSLSFPTLVVSCMSWPTDVSPAILLCPHSLLPLCHDLYLLSSSN